MKFKSTLSLIATMLTIVFCTVRCSEPTTPSDPDTDKPLVGELVITPSDFEIVVTSDSAITFTASIGETDVTEDMSLEIWHVKDNGNMEEVKNNIFSIEEAGTYKFYGFCSNGEKILESETIEVEAVTDGNLYLRASADAVEVGTTVDFTAYMGVDKIAPTASDLKLYSVDGESKTQLEEPSFTVSELKDYHFYATYIFNGEEVKSKTITISGLEWDNTPFAKRTLALQFTGTWCGYCPGFTAVIKDYTAQYGNSKAIFASAHASMGSQIDILDSDATYQLGGNLGVSGFPTLMVGSLDKNKVTSIGLYSNYIQSLDEMTKTIDKLYEADAQCGIKVSSIVENESIAISAEVRVREDGEYGVGALILEDGFEAKQTKYSDLDYIDFGDYNINIHNNVLLYLYPSDKRAYANLGGIISQSAKSGYRLEHTVEFAELTKLSAFEDIDNCSVVIYTYNIATKQIDNAVKAKVGETLDFEYVK